jgi:uncharacterized protein YjbI with pentapeptide repeats
MANHRHVEILKQGTEAWNRWRHRNKDIYPDLSGANLSDAYLPDANLKKADLRRVDLSEAILSEANLNEANLFQANLRGASFETAKLQGADLSEADLCDAILIDAYLPNSNISRANLTNALLRQATLRRANLSGANLNGANLNYADLVEATLEDVSLERADLSNVDLSRANCKGAKLNGAFLVGARLYWTDLSDAVLTDAVLIMATLLETNLENVDLSRSWIYGVSVWNPNLKGAIQHDLVITSSHTDKSIITVDNLEIAQFVYLLTRSERIRNAIDTIGRKAVLILGRFTPERKKVLDALREELRNRNYIPILFDFDKPDSRDLTETVVTLAHLSRFVIADLTDPSSVPHELMSFVPNLSSVPVQPIVDKQDRVYAMFEHLQNYPWVLPIYKYETQDQLVVELRDNLIQRLEEKARQEKSEL